MAGGTKWSTARFWKRALIDERKAKATTKAKTSHEGKNKNLRTAEVSLDNADTVIEGGPSLTAQRLLPVGGAQVEPVANVMIR